MPLRRKAPPPRSPHPDPAVELKLQRILSLQDSVDRRARLIEDYQGEIASLHATARDRMIWSELKAAAAANSRADELGGKISALEAEIVGVGEQVAALQDGINPSDLAWLYAQLPRKKE